MDTEQPNPQPSAEPVAPATPPEPTVLPAPLPQPVTPQPVAQQSEPAMPAFTVPTIQELPIAQPTVNNPVVGPQMTQPVAGPSSRRFKLPLSRLLKDGRKLALLGAALLFALISSVAVYFVLANRDSQQKISELEKQISVLGADTHDLPQGAIQASECIPNMGFHYIDPDSDPRFGPYYLVNKQGKVIGFEYMFNHSMLTSVPAGIDLEVLLTDGPVSLHGWQYESIEFARSPSGHPGFTEDHVDVHAYTVTPVEQKKACE
jgi:hypothetical protein